MTLVTHFLSFPTKAAALSALASTTGIISRQTCPLVVSDGQGGHAFDPSFVDANQDGSGIPTTHAVAPTALNPSGRVPDVTFQMNVALDALDTTLPGLIGAGYRASPTEWVTLWGAKPAKAPQREFAS
jgi:hypothetical protein